MSSSLTRLDVREVSKRNKLTPLQERFVRELTSEIHSTYTQAARAAGYSEQSLSTCIQKAMHSGKVVKALAELDARQSLREQALSTSMYKQASDLFAMIETHIRERSAGDEIDWKVIGSSIESISRMLKPYREFEDVSGMHDSDSKTKEGIALYHAKVAQAIRIGWRLARRHHRRTDNNCHGEIPYSPPPR